MEQNFTKKIVPQQVEAYRAILEGEEEIQNFGDIIIEYDKALKDEIELIFRSSELVTSVNCEKIDIGTVATLDLNGEPEEVVLVETNEIPVSTKYGFVGLNSPLGQAISGLSVGDTFSYSVEEEVVNGTVVALNSDYTLGNENGRTK